MIEQSLVTLLIVVVTVFISYKGFTNNLFQENYAFNIDRIMIHKDYIRMISSGFLHNSWMHLIFNMLALYFFGAALEPLLGGIKLLFIYFAALIGAGLLELLIHKNHGDHTSVGASGAVNGIVFASIALYPGMGIGFFFLPISIPAWAFGLAYVVFSIYGINAKWGNSGHAAHLGGALIGMLLAIAMYPEMIQVNYLPILVITVPTIAFILLIIYKPEFLLLDSSVKKRTYRSIDHDYNYKKAQEQADIDSILEKIHKKGINSLSKQEKLTLEEYSRIKK